MKTIMIALVLFALPADAKPVRRQPATDAFEIRLTGYVERSMVVVIHDDGTVDMRGGGGCYDVGIRMIDGVEMHEITPC